MDRVDGSVDGARARRVGVRMSLGLIIMGGAVCAVRLPVVPSPEHMVPVLEVSMQHPGLSPEQIERMLTARVEELVRMTEGIRSVVSISREDGLTVRASCDPDDDVLRIRADVAGNLQAFSEGQAPGTGRPEVNIGLPAHSSLLKSFMTLGLWGDADGSELAEAAKELVVNELRTVTGLARIAIEGETASEILVVLKKDAGLRYGVTSGMLMERLRAARVDGPAGVFRVYGKPPATLSVPEHMRRIGELPVRILENGGVVRVADCAEVTVRNSWPRWRINGLPAILVRLDRKPETDVGDLASEVNEKLRCLVPRFPAGVQWSILDDPGTDVRTGVSRAFWLAAMSLALVAAMVGLVNRSLTSGARTAVALLAAAGGTLVILRAAGMTLNSSVAVGIALGCGCLAGRVWVPAGGNDRDVIAAKRWFGMVPSDGSKYLPVSGVFAGLVITWYSRVLDAGSGDVALADIGVGLASACGAYLLVSALMETAAGKLHPAPCIEGGAHRFDRLYERVARWCVRRKRGVVLVGMMVVGVPLWMLPRHVESSHPLFNLYLATVGSGWYTEIRPYVDAVTGGVVHMAITQLPIVDRSQEFPGIMVVADMQLPPGSNSDGIRIAAEAMELRTLGLVGNKARVVTNIRETSAQLRVMFAEERTGDVLPVRVKAELTGLAAGLGNASISVAGIGPGFHSGQEPRASFTVGLRGYDHHELERLAVQFQSVLQHEPRIHDVVAGTAERRQEIRMQVRKDRWAGPGSSSHEVADACRTLTAAIDVLELPAQSRVIPVRVAPASIVPVEIAVEEHVTLRNGRMERLEGLVNRRIQQTESVIVRENQEYLRDVSFVFDGPEEYGRVIVEEVIRSFPIPRGYGVVLAGGEGAVKQHEVRPIVLGGGLALLAAVLVMAALNESWMCAHLVLVTCPLSLAGFCLSCLLWGYPLWLWALGACSLVMTVGFHMGYQIAACLPLRHAGTGDTIGWGLFRVKHAVFVALVSTGALLPWTFGGGYSVAFPVRCSIVGILSTLVLETLFLPPLLLRSRRPPGPVVHLLT